MEDRRLGSGTLPIQLDLGFGMRQVIGNRYIMEATTYVFHSAELAYGILRARAYATPEAMAQTADAVQRFLNWTYYCNLLRSELALPSPYPFPTVQESSDIGKAFRTVLLTRNKRADLYVSIYNHRM